MAVDVDATRVVADIAEAVRGGKCILFLGAGVHAPPPDGVSVRVSAGRETAGRFGAERELADSCGLAERFPNEDRRRTSSASPSSTRSQRSRRQLVEARPRARCRWASSRRRCSARSPSSTSRVVITTNYDQLFESALARGRQAAAGGASTRRSSRRRPTTATRRRRARSSSRFTATSTRPETIVVTDEDYIQFVLRMSNKDPYDPVPLTLKAYLTELDDAVRRLQPARLQPSAAVQDAALEDRHREPARHVLGRLHARPADPRRLAQPAPLREVHRPGRVGVRPGTLYEAVLGKRAGAIAVRRPRRCRRRPGDSLPRHPAVPLRRPPDLLRARGGDRAISSSLVAVYRGVMLYGDSGAGKSSLINAGLVPRRRSSSASSPSACACSRARARSSWSSGSRPTSADDLAAVAARARRDARRGSCSPPRRSSSACGRLRRRTGR